jgi:hypothetical protein
MRQETKSRRRKPSVIFADNRWISDGEPSDNFAANRRISGGEPPDKSIVIPAKAGI